MRRNSAVVIIVAVVMGVFLCAAYAQDATRTGDITKIDAKSKSFTVKTSRGETSITTTDSTVIKDGDKTLKFDDLKTGDNVKVTGVRKESGVEAKEILKQAKQ